MLSDFELITHHFPERNDIKIYPISDVHLGAAEHMTREWELFCQRVVNEPNSYIILGGDLINNGTRTSVTNIFEETMRPREQKKVMAKMLEPLQDKILCAASGNRSGWKCNTGSERAVKSGRSLFERGGLYGCPSFLAGEKYAPRSGGGEQEGMEHAL